MRKQKPRFAICVQSDDRDILTPRMIYRVLHDKTAENVDYVRVVDNEGEDYLYPSKFFVLFDFPNEIQRVLSRTPHEVSSRTSRETLGRDRKKRKPRTVRTA